jgi:CRP-like cAMP-binding protein
MGQGDQADALYLVVSGRFAVEVDAERQSVKSLSLQMADARP